MRHSPRSELVDSNDNNATTDAWGPDSLRNAQNNNLLWGLVNIYLRGENKLSKDEFKRIPGRIESYRW